MSHYLNVSHIIQISTRPWTASTCGVVKSVVLWRYAVRMACKVAHWIPSIAWEIGRPTLAFIHNCLSKIHGCTDGHQTFVQQYTITRYKCHNKHILYTTIIAQYLNRSPCKNTLRNIPLVCILQRNQVFSDHSL